MCGIMGYYCFGDRLPDKEKITTMFTVLESRGRDASGFAFIRDHNLIVHKDAVRSSELVKSDVWKKLSLPKTTILHTRMKTQGTEKNNANNHPLFNKEGLCIVHNGMIHNDREIFGKNKRDAEVDSEAILAVLSAKSKGDKIKRVFDKLEGSFAFAVIDKNNPETLILVKKDNPLEMYFDAKNEILYFCSEREIMRESLNLRTQTIRGFTLGEGDYHHYTMENNHSLVISKDGVESNKKYFPKRHDYSFHDYLGAKETRRVIDGMMMECPHCLGMTTYYDGKLFNRCEECGQPIEEEDFYV